MSANMKRISLWLCADEKTPAHTHLSSLVSSISSKHSCPSFTPHITLWSLSTPDIPTLLTSCDTLASHHPSFITTCTTLATHPTNPWMTLVTLIEKDAPLLALREEAEKTFPETSPSRSFPTPPTYTPHISLLYAKNLSAFDREMTARDVGRDILKGYQVKINAITVMDTSSDDYTQWTVLHRSTLTGTSLTSTSTSTSTSNKEQPIPDANDASHLPYISLSNAFAEYAIKQGNEPFGSCLVVDGLVMWSAENNVFKPVPDITHHAELNLISQSSRVLSQDMLKRCILYTSTEPCAMCSGAIYWSGIRGVVYCTSVETVKSFCGDSTVPCRIILQDPTASHRIDVIGPVNEGEGIRVHQSFFGQKK